MKTCCRSASAILLFAGAAVAQDPIIGGAVRVTPGISATVWYGETVIGASSIKPNELVVAFMRHDATSGGFIVYYSVSMNGGDSWPPIQELPIPAGCFTGGPLQGSFDPMIASLASSGDLWVGALGRGAFGDQSPFVARKPVGSTVLTDFAAVACRNFPFFPYVDKPLMAAGRIGQQSHSSDKLFVTWWLTDPFSTTCMGPQGEPVSQDVGAMSNSLIPGQSFGSVFPITDNSSPGVCGFPMFSAFPVVIGPGGENSGNVVIAAGRDLPQYATSTLGAPENQQWGALLGPINRTAPPASEFLFSISNPHVPGNFLVTGVPSVATDPTDANKVYIAFPARVGEASTNVDIIIAQSVDGGKTFPQNRVHRLSDALLGELDVARDVDQFMPSICVDQFGKVNLLFYQSASGDSAPQTNVLVSPRYARLKQFPPSSPSDVFTQPLGPTFSPEVPPFTVLGQSLGDYHWITTSQCYVYVCYLSTHEGGYAIYVNKITISNACVADANDSSTVDGTDVSAFFNALGAGDPKADANVDGNLNALDVVAFMNAYNASVP